MRLIDADALVARLEDDARHMEMPVAQMYTYGAINDIQKEPTVAVMPQWIPCSERLPMEDGEYIITVEDGEGMYVVSNDWRQDWKEWGFWTFSGAHDEPTWRRVTNVVAWMPLPEPYKEEKE